MLGCAALKVVLEVLNRNIISPLLSIFESCQFQFKIILPASPEIAFSKAISNSLN